MRGGQAVDGQGTAGGDERYVDRLDVVFERQLTLVAVAGRQLHAAVPQQQLFERVTAIGGIDQIRSKGGVDIEAAQIDVVARQLS